MTTDHGKNDYGPAVHFPPPLIFVGGFGLGALVQRYVSIPAPWGALPAIEMTGVALMAIGLLLMLTGVVTFRLANVTVMPNRPARDLVTHGIYAFTRNPMYLGLTTAYVGGVFATGLVLPLLLLPVVLTLLTVFVIRREERHLMDTFPEAYSQYRSRVRRWL